MNGLKDFFKFDGLPVFLLHATYVAFLTLLFQGTFNSVYVILNLLGIVFFGLVAIVHYHPSICGAVWCKVLLSRAQMHAIKDVSDLKRPRLLRGHFHNCTDFFNYCTDPIDRFMDVYVKLPILDKYSVEFHGQKRVVFTWDRAIDDLVLNALYLELNHLPRDMENKIITVSASAKGEVIAEYPIEVEFRKIPAEYYGFKQTAYRVLLHTTAALPWFSLSDVWGQLCFWKRG